VRRAGKARKSNFDALFSGGRILSSYPIDPATPCKGLRGSSPTVCMVSCKSFFFHFSISSRPLA
jgi:hypothetical protein